MIAAKSVFRGKLLNVATARVRLPNGFRVSLEIVRHPGAVLIVPMLSAEKIVILRQFRPVIGRYLYELPAGTLDPRETPLVCARRELVEETGYAARRMKKIGLIYPVPGYSTEKITIFQARGLSVVPQLRQQDEVLRPEVITLPEARLLFKSGRLSDAKSICALAMCGWL